MTKYLIKKIINKNKSLITNNSSLILENLEEVELTHLIASLHKDERQQELCVKQLETLVNIYQIHSKQGRQIETEQLELKILSLLGCSENQ